MIRPHASAGRAAQILIALVVVALVIAVRALLYRDLPALLTNDSWDYLKAAQDIHRDGDFFSAWLRDVRLPGYPTLLALTAPLTRWHSDSIVLLQTAVGLATAAMGWGMGRILGSRLVSWVMAAFLGLHPVYLLNEHAVMTEAFALSLYVLLVLVGLAGLTRPRGWPTWTAFGILLGLGTLTRANVVALGAAIAAGACFDRRRASPTGERSSWFTRMAWHLRPALIACAVASMVIAPWVWRNWAAYGRVSFFSSTNRNLVMFKSMHHPLDPSTPTLARVNRMLRHDHIDFDWLWKFSLRFPPMKAERLARRIFDEQVAKDPWLHLADIGESAANFAGFNDSDRSAVPYWFRALVRDVPRMSQLGHQEGASVLQDWVFVPRGEDTAATRIFSHAGEAYLRPGRAIAFLAFLGALALYIVRRMTSRRPTSQTRFRVVLVLSISYLTALGMHAVMLAGYERYASMFDFVIVLITVAIVDEAITARPSMSTGRTVQELPRPYAPEPDQHVPPA